MDNIVEMKTDNEKIEALGYYFYQKAVENFEVYKYEDAVVNFMKAYNCGVNQEYIIRTLYECFIEPNEVEFKSNYNINADGMTNYLYEDTDIDFIPVSDTRYYLFDNKNKQFCGMFDLEQEIGNRQKDFHSILFADIWDIRTILSQNENVQYATVYMLLNGQKSKFYSFFKLPKFVELYLKNVICFENTEIMKLFFQSYSEYYLPKVIVSTDSKFYESIIRNISEIRKKDINTKRTNIFLSICIPSYNRGNLLLENVKHILKLPYDAEIEIVISDNGSTKDVEAYEEIKNLQDSRIKYVRFHENKGYASNVLNVIEHANGRFAMLSSDEDILLLENIKELFNKLYNNLNTGALRAPVIGQEFSQGQSEIKRMAGLDAVWLGMNTNYITGTILNKHILLKNDILAQIYKLRGNYFVECYMHMALSIFAGYYAGYLRMSVPIWNAETVSEFNDWGEAGLLNYMTVESRLLQLDAVMELIASLYKADTLQYADIFGNYVSKTYYLLACAYNARREAFEKRYSWKDACECVYKHSIQMLEKQSIQEGIKAYLRKIYEDYLNKY